MAYAYTVPLASLVLAAALAAGAPAPQLGPLDVALEVALPDDATAPAVFLLDSPVAPTKVELIPDGVAVASSWLRAGRAVVIAVAVPGPLRPGASLRVVPASPPRPGSPPLALRGSAPPAHLPLAAPVGGSFVALALPARSSLRALLLRGDVEDSVLLFEGKLLSRREEPRPARTVTLVPAGPAAILVIVPPDPRGTVALRTASLHTGYALPAPETFRLPAGSGGEYAFEVPERTGPAFLRFETSGVAAPGEVRLDLEGETVWRNDAPLEPAGWSSPLTVELPERLFAHGRASIAVFHLEPGKAAPDPPNAQAPLAGRARERERIGLGLRRLALDVRLPSAGPYGAGDNGDGDHPAEVTFSWWPPAPGAYRLLFHASDLDVPGEIEAVAAGAVVGSVGIEGGRSERDAEVVLPAEVVRAREPNLVTLRETQEPWGAFDWAVSDVRVSPVLPEIPPEPVPEKAPFSDRPSGPVPSFPSDSLTPVAELGHASAPSWTLPMPGHTEPLGMSDLVYGIPWAEDVANQPPPGKDAQPLASYPSVTGPPGLRPYGPPRPPMGPPYPPPATYPQESDTHRDTTAPPPVTGPVVANAPLANPSAGDALPGQPSLWQGPPKPPRPGIRILSAAAEGKALAAALASGTLLKLATEPPGAAVFLSRAPGYRGSFLGLTPVTINDASQGLVHLRFQLAGYHDAATTARLEGQGVLQLTRTLLRWNGIDFARPEDPRDPKSRWAEAGYAAPAPMDVDLDGRFDLVVGNDKGRLVWMRDEEPAGRPRYGKAQPLMRTDGKPIEVERYAAPAAVDWDGDGLVDLLVGSASGRIHFYRRALASRGIAFEDRGLLVADGAPLEAGNDAVPLVVDWNGDGVPDLLVGSGYGIVVLFVGTGDGALTQVGPVTQDGQPVQYLLDVVPVDFSDWTGDGIPDLVLAGMYGNVALLAGKGGGKPDFAAPRPIKHRGGLELYVGTYPHGFALDLDGDGTRDLLFGNSAGEIMWLRGGEPGEFDEIVPLGAPVPAAPAAPPKRK